MRKPCAAIFMTPVIQWNGDVTTCCHDPKIELKIGNINETPLDELWNSPEMTKRRIMQINGYFSYPAKCLNCKNVDGLSITDEQVIDYLISNGREDLINNYATLHKFNLKPKFKVLAKTSEIIEIDPFMPRAQSWDENFGKYLGEDGFKKGYSFIYGKNNGFFEYELPILNGEYEVELNMASPDWERGGKTKAGIFFNGKKIIEFTLLPIAVGKGSDYSFRITPANERIQLLKIQSLSESFGICIMGNPLEEGLSKANIRVRKIK